MRLACGPGTLTELKLRLLRRLTHMFANMHRLPPLVALPGQYVQPIDIDLDWETHLVAEAMTWWRKHLFEAMRPAGADTCERTSEEYEALRLWLRSRAGIIDGNINAILNERAAGDRRKAMRLKRQFYTRVGQGLERIAAGVLEEEIYVWDAPETFLPHRSKKRLASSQTPVHRPQNITRGSARTAGPMD